MYAGYGFGSDKIGGPLFLLVSAGIWDLASYKEVCHMFFHIFL